MEGRIDTEKIRKFEAEYLRKEGYGYFIQNGHGTYHNPRLTEDKKVLKLLNEYRESIKVK